MDDLAEFRSALRHMLGLDPLKDDERGPSFARCFEELREGHEETMRTFLGSGYYWSKVDGY